MFSCFINLVYPAGISLVGTGIRASHGFHSTPLYPGVQVLREQLKTNARLNA